MTTKKKTTTSKKATENAEIREESLQSLSKKIWKMADVLSGAGIAFTDYLSQLTYLLFLKMDDEECKTFLSESRLPEGYRWDDLKKNKGPDLKLNYEHILDHLANEEGVVASIFSGATNKITQPAYLEKLIDMIDKVHWFSESEDVKGALYEGLLQKNGQDKKSGAGQYFTPRPLIDAIVEVTNPRIGETVRDPACGTGGFLLGAFNHMKNQSQDEEKLRFLRNGELQGVDNTDLVVTLGAMNMFLHGVGLEKPVIIHGDSLANSPTEKCDIVLANPPFGARASGSIPIVRDDFIISTSNNQLNFLQHIMAMLRPGGRAAVILPDNVLFERGGTEIRKRCLKDFDLHTILRLPSGIFYAPGVQANVLFFTKGVKTVSATPVKKTTSDKEIEQEKEDPKDYTTKEIWYYDYRSGIKHQLKQNPLQRSDLDDFVNVFCSGDLSERTETYNAESNPRGRWRKFGISEILGRSGFNLDVVWIQEEKDEIELLSSEELLQKMDEEIKALNAAFSSLKEAFQ